MTKHSADFKFPCKASLQEGMCSEFSFSGTSTVETIDFKSTIFIESSIKQKETRRLQDTKDDKV